MRRSVSERRWLLVGALVCTCVAACVAYQLTHPSPDPIVVLLFTAMIFCAEWARIDIAERASISIGAALCLTGAVLTGAVGAAVAGFVGVVLVPRRHPWIAHIFNAVLVAVIACAAGWTYALLGGWGSGAHWERDEVITRVALPLFAAGVAMYLLNVLLLGAMVGNRAIVRRLIERGAVPYAVSTGASLLFISLWLGARLDETSILIMAAPLLLVQWSLRERQSAASARRSTVAMLSSLVDQFDPANAGRSARIDAVVQDLAARLSLSAHDLEQLRHAAGLHALGRIDAARSPRDMVMQSARSCQLLAGMPQFEEAADLIRASAQPWEGGGHAQQPPISLPARVLAVAVAAADGLVEQRAPLLDPDVVALLRKVEQDREAGHPGQADPVETA